MPCHGRAILPLPSENSCALRALLLCLPSCILLLVLLCFLLDSCHVLYNFLGLRNWHKRNDEVNEEIELNVP